LNIVEFSRELGVSILFGGHGHQMINSRVSDVYLVQAGSYMQNFAKVEIDFDACADTVMRIASSLLENKGGTPMRPFRQ